MLLARRLDPLLLAPSLLKELVHTAVISKVSSSGTEHALEATGKVVLVDVDGMVVFSVAAEQVHDVLHAELVDGLAALDGSGGELALGFLQV